MAARGSRQTDHHLTPRQCPVCGVRWATLHCGNDGAVTVLRPHGSPRAKLPMPLGTELDGRYVLTALLDRGAFGAVYAAEQLATGQRVALKVLFANSEESQIARLRFTKESRVLGQLRHPSTVRVFDVGTIDGGKHYFVMELVPGINLEQAFAAIEADGRRLTEAAVIDIALPVLGSLAEAHGLGIVHRDLKPANVMVAEVADDHLVVKVVDFGVVRTHDSNLTARTSVVGTPRYMSPEQCRGGEIDGRADLYSMACVMFEARAGRAPLVADSPLDSVLLQIGTEPPLLSEFGVETSPEFDAILARALRKDPAARFASAVEMRGALQALRIGRLRDEPATAIGDWLPELRPSVEPLHAIGAGGARASRPSNVGSNSYRVEPGGLGGRPVSAYAETAIVAGQPESDAPGPSDHARKKQALLALSADRAPSRTLPPLPHLPASGASHLPRESSPWPLDPLRSERADFAGPRGPSEHRSPALRAERSPQDDDVRGEASPAASVHSTVIGVPIPPPPVAPPDAKMPAEWPAPRVPAPTPVMAPYPKVPPANAAPLGTGRSDLSPKGVGDEASRSRFQGGGQDDAAAPAMAAPPPAARAGAPQVAAPPDPRLEDSRPTPMPWHLEGMTAKPAGQGGSQRAVRLPRRAELDAAIAARQQQLDERTRARAEALTAFDLNNDRQKAAQVAPEPAGSRPRHALGRGTIIGTGMRRPAKPTDDGADEER